jgi:hypothetical protein
MRRLAGLVVVIGVATLGTPRLAHAQRQDDVPPAYRPPPGMCRIWIDGVPPGRQPEPTDCPTAIRRRPQNARVIFGDDVQRDSGLRLPAPRGFRPPQREKPQSDSTEDRKGKQPKPEEKRRKPDADVSGEEQGPPVGGRPRPPTLVRPLA